MNTNIFSNAGLFTTALRWVAGWTYFSAFWRRLVLENKLNPEAAGYIGEKFNHFLPNALGIRPIIEYLVSNPGQLWWAMAFFTIIEGIVGLLFMLGIFTRLMSIGVFSLALGILLGSGWLGTTCLDEWQIGILGVASGFSIYLSGGGRYSADHYFFQKGLAFTRKPYFAFLASGHLPVAERALSKVGLYGAVLIMGLTLFTNQYFHGGVYGTLHNLSVKPHVQISDAVVTGDQLSFTVFRDEGADVYGSFLIEISVWDMEGNKLFVMDQNQLARLQAAQISNFYVAKVKPGSHSLVLPLGAKANLAFKDPVFTDLHGRYRLQLLDISGASWDRQLYVE